MRRVSRKRIRQAWGWHRILGWGVLGLIASSAPAADDDLPVIQSRPLGDRPAASRPAEEAAPAKPAPPPGIRIGMQYALIESKRHAAKVAETMGNSGVRTVKAHPGPIQWGRMQKSARRRIDFKALDGFVETYQEAGFRHLMIPLWSHSSWASKEYRPVGEGGNPTPKEQYLDAYATWVKSIVERYDGDGLADMPGLRYPVRWYEIGGAFGTEEPEPVADYVAMLERAHAAAHEASDLVLVAHAGVVTSGAFRDGPNPENLEDAFANSARLIGHSLESIRTLLQAAHAYDLVNLYAHSDPFELEASLQWIRGELETLGVPRPIIIGSSTVSPFMSGGIATSCSLDPDEMGVILPPAVESDRCRLAEHFTRLAGRDDYTVMWVHRLASADLVKKVLVAADHDVFLMNTSLIEDLDWLTSPKAQAKAGNAPWAGMLDVRGNQLRPAFFAVRQLNQHLHGYTKIQRIPAAEPGIRVYRIQRPKGELWIAWVEPDRLLLPTDEGEALEIDLPVQAANMLVERMVTRPGQLRTRPQILIATGGMVTLPVGQQPVFLFSAY